MKLFSRFRGDAAPSAADVPAVSTPPDADDAARIAAIQSLADVEELRRLAALGHNGALADGAVEHAANARLAQLVEAGSIVDPHLIGQLVLEGTSSRLRQLAAERVENPSQIRELIRQVREKDKSVYKILKQKADALNSDERKAAEIAAEIEAICAALERHGSRSFDPLYTATFEHHANRWRSLSPAPDETLQARANTAMDRCRHVIVEHQSQIAHHETQQAAIKAARQAEILAKEAAHDAEVARADAETQREVEAAAVREAERVARAAKREAEEQLLRRVGGLVRKAQGALSEGHTQQAAGLRRSIEQKVQSMGAVPVHLSRGLQQLDGKLNEYKQWKDFAVAPKRIELIEEMESLVGRAEEPKVLAERIKSLQEDWRTISKGILSEAPEDWERFHKASQAAYQPCREYFEAQAKIRQRNLEKRTEVLVRLAAFEAAQSAENPDWRLLANVLREAPQEWRRHSPVERDELRVIQPDFDSSMQRLQAKLDVWHGENAQEKGSLIKRAKHLLTLEDGREAIDAVKRLQELWKEVGAAARDQEQSLWGEFRELCDAVFKKRQQAYADFNAGLEANKTKAVALCEEAERAASLSGAALSQEIARIPEWQSAFDALEELPRNDARTLKTRFERALERCQAQASKQLVLAADRSFTSLFEAGMHIRAYEWASVTQAADSERENLKQAAEAFIAGIERWPKGGLNAVKESLAKAATKVQADVEAAEKTLKLLCVRCEIQSEIATPAEEEALRREYQVQRLMRGIGQGSESQEGDWTGIALDWIRTGPISPTLRESLQSRFLRCWAHRPKPVPAPQISKRWESANERDRGRDRDDGRPGQARGQAGRGGRDGSKSAGSRHGMR
jgi:Domain of Unknown Function (DUF349)